MFVKRIRGPRNGTLRARVLGAGDKSVGFSLKPVRDRPFNPFGSAT
jgi:hypothetical protein